MGISAPRKKLHSAKSWLRSKKTNQNSEKIETLGRLGNLEVRLARNASEIRKAQTLRYKVFYKEMDAKASVGTKLLRRDSDRLDPFCDHVLVIDHKPEKTSRLKPRRAKVVGTYRLLRQDVAEKTSGFYSQDEFDIAPLLRRHASLRFLELGRSCVLKPYRTKKTVELLWHGVWSYILAHKMDVLIGCASFEGTDVKKHALALSYLHHFHTKDDEWQASAIPEICVDMNILEKDTIDVKKALLCMPPLMKGYLRIGAMIGKGAVIDKQFNTIDVLMILPVSKISEKYIGYFGADATRYAEKEMP
ncbi:MAG: GNAT family N-acetyltransferase [Pseudomonadota bacterium]